MDKTEKLLRKMPKSDRLRVREVLVQLTRRDFAGLLRQKLEGYDHLYRVRIGDYRLMYYDDGERFFIKGLKRKNEATYRGL